MGLPDGVPRRASRVARAAHGPSGRASPARACQRPLRLADVVRRPGRGRPGRHRLTLEGRDERSRAAREVALGAEREWRDAAVLMASRARLPHDRRDVAREARGCDGRGGRLRHPWRAPTARRPRVRCRARPDRDGVRASPRKRTCGRTTPVFNGQKRCPRTAPTGRRRCPRARGARRRARRSSRAPRALGATAEAGSRRIPRPAAPPRPPPRRPRRRATSATPASARAAARSISGSSRWSSTRSGSSVVKRLTPTITRSPRLDLPLPARTPTPRSAPAPTPPRSRRRHRRARRSAR